MFEGLPWGTLTPLTALLVVLLLVIRAIVTGRWRPKSAVDELLTVLRERLADRDETIREMRAANAALMEAVRTLTVQSDETLALGRATHAVVEALRDPGDDV